MYCITVTHLISHLFYPIDYTTEQKWKCVIKKQTDSDGNERERHTIYRLVVQQYIDKNFPILSPPYAEELSIIGNLYCFVFVIPLMNNYKLNLQYYHELQNLIKGLVDLQIKLVSTLWNSALTFDIPVAFT